jgi:hypothetical protein
MIFKITGYFFLVGAIVSILNFDLFASLICAAVSVVLLLKNPSTNKWLAKVFNRVEIPTLSGWIHAITAFVLLWIGGQSLPPKPAPDDIASLPAQPSIQSNNKPATTPPAHSEPTNQPPRCIMDRLEDAARLWGQLKSYRYEDNFHKYGFTQGGPYGNWEIARKEGSELYSKCQNNLGGSVKFKFLGLAESYSYMYYVGKDWYQSSGKGKPETQDFIDMIEYALNNDGKAK